MRTRVLLYKFTDLAEKCSVSGVEVLASGVIIN